MRGERDLQVQNEINLENKRLNFFYYIRKKQIV